jgi:hypothetical protein
VEARFPASADELGAREADGLAALLEAGRLDAGALAKASDAAIRTLISRWAPGATLFSKAGAVLALVPEPRRGVVAAGGPAQALAHALSGGPSTRELDRALDDALAFEPEEHRDPVPYAKPAVAFLDGLPPGVRTWAWAAVERIGDRGQYTRTVLEARKRRGG